VITANGRHGVESGGHSLIKENTVADNALTGISAVVGALVLQNSVTHNNTSNSPTEAGIKVVLTCLVEGNSVQYNDSTGILTGLLGSPSINSMNSIQGNFVLAFSGKGIHFQSSSDVYSNNRASGSPSYQNAGNQIDGGGNITIP